MTDIEPDPAPLVLDGVLTIRTIEPVRASLLEALERSASVQVDCTAAEAVDVCFIQLLLAARRSALKAGKRLLLTAPAAGPLLATLEQGGFLGTDPLWSGDA